MPRAGEALRLLLLGGTREAREIATALAGEAGITVVTSLAGRTRTPLRPPGALRVGGFGGIDGLVAWLREAEIDFVLDATHPFARRISAHVREACRRLRLPHLRLERPPWRAEEGDRWLEMPDLDAALTVLPRFGRRVFVNLGRQEVARLATCPECRFLLRVVEPLPELPGNVEMVAGRPPYTVAGDRALLARCGIQALLVRNSGGQGAYPKLVAARQLGLPVVMIARPAPLAGDHLVSAEAAIAAVLAHSRGRSRW